MQRACETQCLYVCGSKNDHASVCVGGKRRVTERRGTFPPRSLTQRKQKQKMNERTNERKSENKNKSMNQQCDGGRFPLIQTNEGRPPQYSILSIYMCVVGCANVGVSRRGGMNQPRNKRENAAMTRNDRDMEREGGGGKKQDSGSLYFWSMATLQVEQAST